MELRVMTYNLHSGLGLDERRSWSRIAEVVQSAGVDVLAVQELWQRSEGSDLERLKVLLHMEGAFTATETNAAGEHYGHAVLWRPELAAAGAPKPTERLALPSAPNAPRCASRVGLQLGSKTFNVVNMHLGLQPPERLAQTQALAAAGWFEGLGIVMGDLNATPWVAALKPIERRLRRVSGWRTRTWPAPLPWLPLDHIFVSPQFKVLQVKTVGAGRARWASDHLPLWARLRLGGRA